MNTFAKLIVQLDDGELRQISVFGQMGSLADILAGRGLPLNTRCHHRGLCRGCEVTLYEGKVKIDGHIVSAPAVVQACCARWAGEASIQILAGSRQGHEPQTGAVFEIAVPCAHHPLFAPGARDTGFAVNLGATKASVLLTDLVTGEVLAHTEAVNAPRQSGPDAPRQTDAPQIADIMAQLLQEACNHAERAPGRLAGGTLSGESAMVHLLDGTQSTAARMASFSAGRAVTAAQIGLVLDGLAPETPLRLLPEIAADIGSDMAASICATGVAFDSAPSLLVDLGSQTRIVLQCDGKLLASVIAGSHAVEGIDLTCGTGDRFGAVSKLSLQLEPFQLSAEVIGGLPLAEANGISGPAYVDFLAAALPAGLIDEKGHFVPAGWETIPAEYRQDSPQERALLLAPESPLRISEADIAHLLRARAAIAAGIEFLMEKAKVRTEEVERVCVAGAFGMHLNIVNAIAVGFLPGFPAEHVHVVGNAALGGALLALRDQTILYEMDGLRRQVEVVEPNFGARVEDQTAEHFSPA